MIFHGIMKFYLLLIIALILQISLVGQTSKPQAASVQLHSIQDSIEIEIDAKANKWILHSVKKGETLFSISRYYGLEIEELLQLNPNVPSQLSIGQVFKIPLPNRAIKRFQNKKYRKWLYVPLVYTVKPGENLYQIAKKNFAMSYDTLLKRNGLKNANVQAGRKIHVGWMHINGIPDSIRDFSTIPGWEKQSQSGKQFRSGQGSHPYKKHGAASTTPGFNSEHVCLFNSAKKGAIIAIYNPMLGRTVYARCIGPIPKGVYEEKVIILVTSELKKLLGARDEYFYVHLQY